jgi:FkbM family methyltransferase
MKHRIMAILQKVVGLENYYFLFACFKIYALNWDSRKRTYNYFVKLLEPHYNVLIAGGFIGITTIPIAKQCYSGRSYVFEPVLLNFNVLERIKKYFKFQHIKISNGALGNIPQALKIKTPILNGAVYNGMSHLEHLDYLDTSTYIENTTQIYNGDAFFKEEKLALQAIKLVAENYEWEIYNGLQETILKDRPIIYTELWDKMNRDKIFQLFNDWDYSIFILDEQNNLILYNSSLHLTKFFILKPNHKQ